jgi:uncharacterized protein YndB with AHSA1/START domain
LTLAAINLTRIIKAPRERVFRAWTDPEQLVKWWGPGHVTCPKAEVDLRPGGAYRIANLHDDGKIIWISGQFETVDPPNGLQYTWAMSAGDPTLVTVTFNEHPEGTELVLTHERFVSEKARDLHQRGWVGCLEGLEALLAPGN